MEHLSVVHHTYRDIHILNHRFRSRFVILNLTFNVTCCQRCIANKCIISITFNGWLSATVMPTTASGSVGLFIHSETGSRISATVKNQQCKYNWDSDCEKLPEKLLE